MSNMTLKELQEMYPFEQTGLCVRHDRWVMATTKTQKTVSCPMCSAEEAGITRGDMRHEKDKYAALWAENLRLNKKLEQYEKLMVKTIENLLGEIPPLEYQNQEVRPR